VAGQQQELKALSQKLLAAVPPRSAGQAAVASLQQRYMHAVVTHLVGVAPLSLHSLLTICLDAKLSEWAADSPVQLADEARSSWLMPRGRLPTISYSFGFKQTFCNGPRAQPSSV
jgi:hypothetical protein